VGGMSNIEVESFGSFSFHITPLGIGVIVGAVCFVLLIVYAFPGRRER
jgi:hypothetical protein